MSKVKNDEVEHLERNLVTAAKVVKLHGEKYVPIFKRVKQEFDQAKGDKETYDLIDKLAA